MNNCDINNDQMKKIYQEIGLNVKRIRRSKNISQLALSLAIGHKAVGTVSMAELCINKQAFQHRAFSEDIQCIRS